MSRSFWFTWGFIAIAATTPALGQGKKNGEVFLEKLGQAINQAIEEGNAEPNGNNGNGNNGDNGGGRQLYGWNPYYHPEMWHPDRYPPYNQGGRIWVDDHWEYLPNGTPGGNVIYPGQTVVGSATTVTNTLPYKGPGVTIELETDEGGQVTYTIDGKESSTIQAGQEQTLTSKGKYEINFSRGKTEDGRDFGQARYTITEGNYHFKVTDKGWDLFRDKEQPNLVATQATSPAGIKTNALPPRTQSTAPAASASPATNALPATK